MRTFVAASVIGATALVAGALPGRADVLLNPTQLQVVDLADHPIEVAVLHSGVEDPIVVHVSEVDEGATPVSSRATFDATLPRGVSLVRLETVDGRTGAQVSMPWSCHETRPGTESCSASTTSLGAAWSAESGIYVIAIVRNALAAGVVVRTPVQFAASLPGGTDATVSIPVRVGATGVAHLQVLSHSSQSIGLDGLESTDIVLRNDGRTTARAVGSAPLAQLADVLPGPIVSSWSNRSANWSCAGAPSSSPSCTYTGGPISPGAMSTPLVLVYRTVASTPRLPATQREANLAWHSTLTLPGPYGQELSASLVQHEELVHHLAVDVAVRVQPIGSQLLHVGGSLTVAIETAVSDGAPGGIVEKVVIPNGTSIAAVHENGWFCPAGAGTITCRHSAPLVDSGPSWFEVHLHAPLTTKPALGIVAAVADDDGGAGHGANLTLVEIVGAHSTGLFTPTLASATSHSETETSKRGSARSTVSTRAPPSSPRESPADVRPHNQGPPPASTLYYPGITFTDVTVTWDGSAYTGTATATFDGMSFAVDFSYVDAGDWSASFSQPASGAGATLTPSGSVSDTSGTLSTSLSVTASGTIGGLTLSGVVSSTITLGTVTPSGTASIAVDGVSLPVSIATGSSWVFAANGTVTLGAFTFTLSGSVSVDLSGPTWSGTLDTTGSATADGVTLNGALDLSGSGSSLTFDAGLTSLSVDGLDLPVTVTAGSSWTVATTYNDQIALAGFQFSISGSFTLDPSSGYWNGSLATTGSATDDGITLSGTITLSASNATSITVTAGINDVSVDGFLLPITVSFTDGADWTLSATPQMFSLGSIGDLSVSGSVQDSGGNFSASVTISTVGSLSFPIPNSNNSPFTDVSLNGSVTLTASGNTPIAVSVTSMDIAIGPIEIPLFRRGESVRDVHPLNAFPVGITYTNSSNWSITVGSSNSPESISLGSLGMVGIYGCLGVGNVCGAVSNTGIAASLGMVISASIGVGAATLTGSVVASYASTYVNGFQITSSLDLTFYAGATPVVTIPVTFSYTDSNDWSLTASVSVSLTNFGGAGAFTVSGNITDTSGTISGTLTLATNAPITLVSGVTISGSIQYVYSGSNSSNLTGSFTLSVPAIGSLTVAATYAVGPSATTSWSATVTYSTNTSITMGSVVLPVPALSGNIIDTNGNITWLIAATFTSPITLGSAVTLQGTVGSPLQFSVGNTCAPVDSVVLCPANAGNSVFLALSGQLSVNVGSLGTYSTTFGASYGLQTGAFAVVATLPSIAISIVGLTASITNVIFELSYNDPSIATLPGGTLSLPAGAGLTNGLQFMVSGDVSISIGNTTIPVIVGVTYGASSGLVFFATFNGPSPLSFGGLSLNSFVYVTTAMTIDLNGVPFNIPSGSLVFGGQLDLPSWLTSKLALAPNFAINIDVVYTDPNDFSISATLANLSMPLGAIGAYEFILGPITVSGGLQGGSPFFAIAENGCLLQPAQSQSNNHSCSQSGAIPVSMIASFNTGTGDIDVSISGGTPCLPHTVCTPIWSNIFGLTGLDIYQITAQIGYSIYSQLPDIAFSASGQLPNSLLNFIGVDSTSGAVDFDFAIDISAENPCLAVSIFPAPSYNGPTPTIKILGGVVTASSASLVAAPTGCTIGNNTYAPGFSLDFTGTVLGVAVDISANLTLSPLGLTASVYVASFHVGGFTFQGATLKIVLQANDPLVDMVSFSVGIDLFGSTVAVSGSISLSGVTLMGSANISIAGFTAAVSLSVSVTLSNVAINVSASIQTPIFKAAFSFMLTPNLLYIYGSGTLDPGGYNLGTVTFEIEINGNTQLLSVTGNISFIGITASVAATFVHSNGQIGLYLGLTVSLPTSVGSISGSIVIGDCPTQACSTILSYWTASFSGTLNLDFLGSASISGSISTNGSFSLNASLTVHAQTPQIDLEVTEGYAYFTINASVSISSSMSNWNIAASATVGIYWRTWNVLHWRWNGWNNTSVTIGFSVGSSRACITILVGTVCANL